MFRSRVELADTLAGAEKDRKRHDRELRRTKEHVQELNVALRAADDVGEPDRLGF